MCLHVLGAWVTSSYTCPRGLIAGAGCPPHSLAPPREPQAAPLGHNSAVKGCTVPGAQGRPCWASVAAPCLGAGLASVLPSLRLSLLGKTLPGSVPSLSWGAPGSPQRMPIPGARG